MLITVEYVLLVQTTAIIKNILIVISDYTLIKIQRAGSITRSLFFHQ